MLLNFHVDSNVLSKQVYDYLACLLFGMQSAINFHFTTNTLEQMHDLVADTLGNSAPGSNQKAARVDLIYTQLRSGIPAIPPLDS